MSRCTPWLQKIKHFKQEIPIKWPSLHATEVSPNTFAY